MNIEEKKRLKMAIISGASNALKYKEQNPHASESEIISHLTRNMSEIIGKIDTSS